MWKVVSGTSIKSAPNNIVLWSSTFMSSDTLGFNLLYVCFESGKSGISKYKNHYHPSLCRSGYQATYTSAIYSVTHFFAPARVDVLHAYVCTYLREASETAGSICKINLRRVRRRRSSRLVGALEVKYLGVLQRVTPLFCFLFLCVFQLIACTYIRYLASTTHIEAAQSCRVRHFECKKKICTLEDDGRRLSKKGEKEMLKQVLLLSKKVL